MFNILTLQTILEESIKVKSDRALNGKEAVKLVEERIHKNQLDPCTCLLKR